MLNKVIYLNYFFFYKLYKFVKFPISGGIEPLNGL